MNQMLKCYCERDVDIEDMLPVSSANYTAAELELLALSLALRSYVYRSS